MSALPPIADIPRRNLNVRFGPIRDMTVVKGVGFRQDQLTDRDEAIPIRRCKLSRDTVGARGCKNWAFANMGRRSRKWLGTSHWPKGS